MLVDNNNRNNSNKEIRYNPHSNKYYPRKARKEYYLSQMRIEVKMGNASELDYKMIIACIHEIKRGLREDKRDIVADSSSNETFKYYMDKISKVYNYHVTHDNNTKAKLCYKANKSNK